MIKAVMFGILALAASANSWAITIGAWKATPTQQVADVIFTLNTTTFADDVNVNFNNLGNPFNQVQAIFNDNASFSGLLGGTVTYTVAFDNALSPSKHFTFAQIDANEIFPINLTTTITDPNPDVGLSTAGNLQTAAIPGSFDFLTVTNTLASTGGPLNSFNNTFFYAAPVPIPAAVWLLGLGLATIAGVARRRAA